KTHCRLACITGRLSTHRSAILALRGGQALAACAAIIEGRTEMNKVYRKVWSRALGCVVVASEFANGRGSKPAGRGLGRRPTAALLMLSLLAAAMPSFAIEATGADSMTRGSDS